MWEKFKYLEIGNDFLVMTQKYRQKQVTVGTKSHLKTARQQRVKAIHIMGENVCK